MRTKAEILRRIRDLEHELSPEELSEVELKIDWIVRAYYVNLGRVKALNWVLSKD